MRVRVATTLSLTAVTGLALPACSAETTKAKTSTASPARAGEPADSDQRAAPLRWRQPYWRIACRTRATSQRLLAQAGASLPARHRHRRRVPRPEQAGRRRGDRRLARLPPLSEGHLHLHRW